MELGKVLEHKSGEEGLRVGGDQPGKKEAQEGPYKSLKLRRRMLQPGGGWSFLPGNK